MPLSASELSLTEVRDKLPPLRRLDPGMMPLPDTASGLEWSSLVNAAKAYEGEDGYFSIKCNITWFVSDEVTTISTRVSRKYRPRPHPC